MFCIRRMREEDLADVARLEKEIFSDPWSENAIRESMEQREQKMLSPYAALSLCSRGRERQEEECDVRTVYQRDRDRILHSKAFRRMNVYYVLEDGEIARIAVESDFRRNGVASRLLKELAFICADNGVNKLLLDVRESNESAKAFYKKKGFVLDGVRKNYYTNPTENAILMSLELL